MFEIKIDSSKCISLIEGSVSFDRTTYDCWKYADLSFKSGKIYGIISEYGQGCMYISYLLGGRVEPGDLQIYYNDRKITKEYLSLISWNLEPSHEKYRNETVKKSIEKMLRKGKCAYSFAEIAEKFILTEPRYNRKLYQLSGERWRASAALGYSSGKQIFYAPYETSQFYYQMARQGLIKVLRNLTDAGALVLLPAGSDTFLKHIVDECVYLNREYDIGELAALYANKFSEGNCVKGSSVRTDHAPS